MEWKRKPLQIGHLFHIPLKISYGWFPVFVLHDYAISVHYLPWHFPHLPQYQAWGLGTLTTLLLFLSVLGHELGHALMARAERLPIQDITLHLFGGLTRFRRETSSPLSDFKIAVAGPAATFLHAVVFFLLNVGAVNLLASRPAALVTNYLALVNVILALFNLLPGYPLDGGRMLRAWLWHRHGDFLRATRWAIRAGQGIAFFLIGMGTFWILTWKTGDDIFIGIWFVLVGIFLQDAAQSSREHLPPEVSVHRLRVADVMRPSIAVAPEMTVEQLICDILPHHRQTAFPVSRDGRLHGIVCLEHLRSIPRARWSEVTMAEIMIIVNPKLFVHPHTPLVRAESLLRENRIGVAAVLSDQGYLVGLIRLQDIHRGRAQKTRSNSPV
ncbi:MAG: site-2 protease family protein [Acidobacteria bacterium]|nr:MAG: site-2 protease family protein [Acidobacteriota bacterium]